MQDPDIEKRQQRARMPSIFTGLSARLLVLTIFFVMLAEFLIWAPSVARFRLTYLQERLASAHLAGLAVDATPDRTLSKDLASRLLEHAGAYMVDIYADNAITHMLSRPHPPVEAEYDLRDSTFFGLIFDAFAALAHSGNRAISVLGPSPKDPRVVVDVVLDEEPMRRAMLSYSWRILSLSIVISLTTAALVYLSLQLLTVVPLRRITDTIVRFRNDPEHNPAPRELSRRTDEVGVAERELAAMQESLRAALRQQARLAELGGAVSKINHDLRNILATAQIVSDRLMLLDDPAVQRLTRPLLAAIDRAVKLCNQTLDYSRGGAMTQDRSTFPLAALVRDVGQEVLVLPGRPAEIACGMAEDLTVSADRDQLFRVLSNLMRNAVEAGATRLDVSAASTAEGVVIDIRDNGPGIPEDRRASLFRAFAGSAKRGGSGLGLAIAHDLMTSHRGTIELVASDDTGSRFRLVLPHAADGAS